MYEKDDYKIEVMYKRQEDGSRVRDRWFLKDIWFHIDEIRRPDLTGLELVSSDNTLKLRDTTDLCQLADLLDCDTDFDQMERAILWVGTHLPMQEQLAGLKHAYNDLVFYDGASSYCRQLLDRSDIPKDLEEALLSTIDEAHFMEVILFETLYIEWHGGYAFFDD